MVAYLTCWFSEAWGERNSSPVSLGQLAMYATAVIPFDPLNHYDTVLLKDVSAGVFFVPL